MNPDQLNLLVEGLVSERKAREAKLQGLVDQLLGKPKPLPPPEPEPPSPPPPPEPPPVVIASEPEPPPPVEIPEPPVAPAPDATEPLREALAALRAEKEALLQKNLALYDELQKYQEQSQHQREVLEGQVAEAKRAVTPGESTLQVRIVQLENILRERDEILMVERQYTDQAKAELTTARTALSAAQADLQARELALAEARSELSVYRQSLTEAQRQLDTARALSGDSALAARLKEGQEARARLEVELRSAHVQVTVMEQTLRQREQALAGERQQLEQAKQSLQEALEREQAAGRSVQAQLAALQGRLLAAEQGAAGSEAALEEARRKEQDQAARASALEEVLKRRDAEAAAAMQPRKLDRTLVEMAQKIQASRANWLDTVISELTVKKD